MKAEELIRAGKLDEALAALKEAVRDDPAASPLRVCLFQLLGVLGDWEAALAQLNVLGEMDAECKLLAEMYRPALLCEALRAEVFAGQRTPLIFGEPAEWIVWLFQSLTFLSQDKVKAAAKLRDQAFEAAPSVPGTINDQPFEWIADADTRLGPVLEAVLDGNYYWIPFQNIRNIRFEKPQDLRDTVWLPAYFTWVNEGSAAGLIPVRYPGSEHRSDPAIQMARKTDWREAGHDIAIGSGQRMFATDQDEYPLLETTRIAFDAQTTDSA